MKTTRLIQIGGVINLLLVAFHLSFWKMFNWGESLASLSPDNRAVMQVLNLHTAYALGLFAVLSLFFANELSATKWGRIISLSITGFWILRGANQLVFWGLSLAGSWIILVICLAVAALYLIPVNAKRALTH